MKNTTLCGKILHFVVNYAFCGTISHFCGTISHFCDTISHFVVLLWYICGIFVIYLWYFLLWVLTVSLMFIVYFYSKIMNINQKPPHPPPPAISKTIISIFTISCMCILLGVLRMFLLDLFKNLIFLLFYLKRTSDKPKDAVFLYESNRTSIRSIYDHCVTCNCNFSVQNSQS